MKNCSWIAKLISMYFVSKAKVKFLDQVRQNSWTWEEEEKKEEENIEVLEINIEQAMKMVDNGEIKDGKTIMLLQYLKLKNILWRKTS